MAPYARHSIGAAVIAVSAAIFPWHASAASAAPRELPVQASPVSSPSLAWKAVASPTSPMARTGAAMAYDAATHYLLLYGGTAPGGQILGDTWEFDGTTWTQLHPPQSPPPLAEASMAYDATLGAPGGQLLLFGGNTSVAGTPTPTNQTWVWNGFTWTQPNPTTSPPPRSDASLSAFEGAQGGEFVLFGGIGEAGTTAPSNATQSSEATDSPSSSTTAAATAITDAPGTATAATATAATAAGTLDDTWTWNGTSWTEEPAAASDPPARSDGAATWDPDLGEVVLFGGTADGTTGAGSLLGDLWAWGGSGWSQLRPASQPSARSGATLTNDPELGGDLLVDGQTAGGPSSGVWLYAQGAWKTVTAANSPGPRTSASAAWDTASSQLVIFGGSASDGTLYGSTDLLGTAPSVSTPSSAQPTTTTPATATTTVPGQRPPSPTTATTAVPPATSTVTTTPAAPTSTTAPPQPPAIVAITGAGSSPSTVSPTVPIAASRTSSHPGAQVVVSGSGYEPEAHIAVWFHSSPVLLGNATANGNGHFNLEVTVPANAAPGDHHFEAEGLYRTGKVESFTIPLQVTLPPPPGRSHTEDIVLVLVALGVPVATWAAMSAVGRRRKRSVSSRPL